MLNDLFDLVRIFGIPNIVEVGFITLGILRQLIWKVLGHAIERQYLLVQVLDTNLIEGWHIHKVDIIHLEQSLVTLDHILEEVLGYLMVW